MAMKVYKSGEKCVIEKDANPQILIPIQFSYVRVEGDVVSVFNTNDATVGDFDTVANIQDSGGTPIGNIQEVVKYLNGFIFSGSTVSVPVVGGGTGEINTGSNVGTGDGVFKQKTGVDLEFKTLIGGTNVTITNNANDLTINASGGGGATLRNVSATDTFSTANETINCTSGTFTVNLPTATGIQGTVFTLVNSGTGRITLDGNGTETINGSLTILLKKQYISRTVQSDGSDWIVI